MRQPIGQYFAARAAGPLDLASHLDGEALSPGRLAALVAAGLCITNGLVPRSLLATALFFGGVDVRAGVSLGPAGFFRNPPRWTLGRWGAGLARSAGGCIGTASWRRALLALRGLSPLLTGDDAAAAPGHAPPLAGHLRRGRAVGMTRPAPAAGLAVTTGGCAPTTVRAGTPRVGAARSGFGGPRGTGASG